MPSSTTPRASGHGFAFFHFIEASEYKDTQHETKTLPNFRPWDLDLDVDSSFRRVVETRGPGLVGFSSVDSLGFRQDVTVSPGPTLYFVVFRFPSLSGGGADWQLPCEPMWARFLPFWYTYVARMCVFFCWLPSLRSLTLFLFLSRKTQTIALQGKYKMFRIVFSSQSGLLLCSPVWKE